MRASAHSGKRDLGTISCDFGVTVRGGLLRFLLGVEPVLFAFPAGEAHNAPMAFSIRFFGISNFKEDWAPA